MITQLIVKTAIDSFATPLELDTDIIPIHRFEWNYEMAGSDIKRMMAPGRHSWHKFVEHMPIQLEGAIVADDTTTYWDIRKGLLTYFVPAADNIVLDPVKFELTLDGDAEVYYAYCVNEMNAGALDTAIGSTTISDFVSAFSCRFGYWRKSSDDTPVVF